MFDGNRNSMHKSQMSESTVDSAEMAERQHCYQQQQQQQKEEQPLPPLPPLEAPKPATSMPPISTIQPLSINNDQIASRQTPARPALVRIPSVQTRYMEMLLHLDEIPRLHNILAALFTWILLAGFLVVPGTFTSFKNSEAFRNANEDKGNEIAYAIVHGIANIGLLWLSGAFCVLGVAGCLWLWFKWRKNYVWVINRIFLPTTLNSVAGLLTTVVNVYTAQKSVWSVTAKITAIVTGSCIGVAGGLFATYNFWVLKKVQKLHHREFDPEEYERNRKRHKRESVVEKMKRKAHEPALQPGSVV